MAKSTIVNFLSSASPVFVAGEEKFMVKPGFNEMPVKFTKDEYYDLCVKGGIIKDFVATPTDKQQEAFDKQLQAEREEKEALQKELDELKAAAANKETPAE